MSDLRDALRRLTGGPVRAVDLDAVAERARRLRRRARARRAGAGLLVAAALVAAVVVLVRPSQRSVVATAGPGPLSCAAARMRVSTGAEPEESLGAVEAVTLHNGGSQACSIGGYPRLGFGRPARLVDVEVLHGAVGSAVFGLTPGAWRWSPSRAVTVGPGRAATFYLYLEGGAEQACGSGRLHSVPLTAAWAGSHGRISLFSKELACPGAPIPATAIGPAPTPLFVHVVHESGPAQSPPTTTNACPLSTRGGVPVWSGRSAIGPGLQVYATEEPSGACAELVATPAGSPTAPGKPAYRPASRFEPASLLVSRDPLDFGATLWRSSHGAVAYLVYGHARGGAARLVVTGDGPRQVVAVEHGWYAYALPRPPGDLSETISSRSGRTLGTSPPGRRRAGR